MELVMTVSQKLQKMFDNFFETIKEEIKKENKKFNVVLMKFMKRFQSFSQNQKVSAFESFDTSFLDRKLTNFKVQPTAVSRKKTKIDRRKRLSNVGTKSLSNLPISLKRKHNMKDIVNMNVPSAKEAGQSVASNTKLFTIQNQNLRIYNIEQFVNITRICCNKICYV